MISNDPLASDPLGLTMQQRLEGELKSACDEYLNAVRQRIEALDALPDGTMLRVIDGHGRVSIRSVESLR